MLSNYKNITPASILAKLQDKNGKIVKIGQQEDISEFNDLLLQRMEEGLHALEGKEEDIEQLDKIDQQHSIVKKLFYGAAAEYIEGFEKDGTSILNKTETVFKNLVCSFTKQLLL